MATIAELTVADEPAAWRAVGFAVEGRRCSVGTAAVRLAGGGAGSGLVEWALRGIATDDLDGLATVRSNAPLDGAAPPHPNGVTAIDHLVIVSPALDRTVAAFQAAGLDLRCIREEPTPAGAPRQAFFRLGAELVEVVEEPAEVTARAGGADRPARFWGLAFRTPDLPATVARLGSAVGEVRPAVQPGRQIASLRRAAGLGLPVALITAPRHSGAPGGGGRAAG